MRYFYMSLGKSYHKIYLTQNIEHIVILALYTVKQMWYQMYYADYCLNNFKVVFFLFCFGIISWPEEMYSYLRECTVVGPGTQLGEGRGNRGSRPPQHNFCSICPLIFLEKQICVIIRTESLPQYTI